MMPPPVFKTLDGDAALHDLLRSGSVTRVFPFGEAPQSTAKPYVVWQIVGGPPGQCLGSRPTHDDYMIQLDVYAKTAAQVETVARAVRDAVELKSRITSWRTHGREDETQLYRVGIDIQWPVLRGTATP